jgi:hypothetical protein
MSDGASGDGGDNAGGGNLIHIFGGAYEPAPRTGPYVEPPEVQLSDAIFERGMTPPDPIVLDGHIHRFGRDKSCWYILNIY